MAKNICKIQYASDLHLEHYEKMAFPSLVIPAARILCLAGDIGNPRKELYASFLEYCHDKWDHVFVIAGNHEYFNHRPINKESIDTHDERLTACRSICEKWTNVHFLEKDSVFLNDYNLMVLGTTAWSPVPPEKEYVIKSTINDYKYIAKNIGEAIEPKDVTGWHMESVKWLDAKIFEAEENGHNVLVMTHHMPSVRFINPIYLDNDLNCAYAAPMDEFMRPPIRAWIYGHTHDQKVTRILHGDETTICAVNAYGYNVRERAKFSREAVIDIPCGPWLKTDILA